jgi:hypothetical protein
MSKIAFYHYDWKEGPELRVLNAGLSAVFDGSNVPVMTKVDCLDWDQHTIAFCSQSIDKETVERVCREDHDTDDNDSEWWNVFSKDPLKPVVTYTVD